MTYRHTRKRSIVFSNRHHSTTETTLNDHASVLLFRHRIPDIIAPKTHCFEESLQSQSEPATLLKVVPGAREHKTRTERSHKHVLSSRHAFTQLHKHEQSIPWRRTYEFMDIPQSRNRKPMQAEVVPIVRKRESSCDHSAIQRIHSIETTRHHSNDLPTRLDLFE